MLQNRSTIRLFFKLSLSLVSLIFLRIKLVYSQIFHHNNNYYGDEFSTNKKYCVEKCIQKNVTNILFYYTTSCNMFVPCICTLTATRNETYLSSSENNTHSEDSNIRDFSIIIDKTWLFSTLFSKIIAWNETFESQTSLQKLENYRDHTYLILTQHVSYMFLDTNAFRFISSCSLAWSHLLQLVILMMMWWT